MPTLPILSAAIAVAKDTPEMFPATPIGFCVCQSSLNKKTPADETINERVNSPQKMPPSVLTFSLTASPKERNHFFSSLPQPV